MAGAIIGGIGGGISDASRVEMAAGGIVKRPTKAIVGEAGPEAVTPLKQGKIPVDNKEVVKAIKSLNETVFKTRLVGGPTYQITRNA